MGEEQRSDEELVSEPIRNSFNKQDTRFTTPFWDTPRNWRGLGSHFGFLSTPKCLLRSEPMKRISISSCAATHNVGVAILGAECKRVNPAFSRWCFVRTPYTRRGPTRESEVFFDCV